MTHIELRIIGHPELRAAGQPVKLHSAKTMALLAFFALESGRPHSRERLAELLWGGSPEALARKSLRQALYSLRLALGDLGATCLEVQPAVVSLRPSPALSIDALAILQPAADLASLRRAVGLCRGPLLDGLQLDDCPAFEEWLFFQRDAIDQRALVLREGLTGALRAAGQLDEALAAAQQLLAQDPLRESAYRELMRIAAAHGSREGVAHQFRRCADVLARELGVEPSAETSALYRELLEARPAPRPPARAAAPETLFPALPFVGRADELQQLHQYLLATADGTGALVLLEGVAGSGKTRLVDEARARAAAQGLAIRWLEGRCYQSEAQVPYMLWGELLRELATPACRPLVAKLPALARQQLARLLPELGPGETGSGDPAESRLRLLQGVAQTLACLAGERPLVLVLEDLHWADPASTELLHYVARQLRGAPVLLLGTYRTEEAGDIFARLQGGSGSAGAPARLALRPLRKGDIERLLRDIGLTETTLGERLYRHCGGNPFLVAETLRALTATGRLRREGEQWRLADGDGALPVPAQVSELLRNRIAALSGEQRRLLAAAAVVGRACTLQLLRQVSGIAEPQLLAGYAELRQRMLLADGAERHTVTFAHEYVRQVVYEEIAPLQRAALHRRAGEALEGARQLRGRATAEEIAFHYAAADDPRAVAFLERAAHQAVGLCAFGRATELFDQALALLDRAPEAEQARLLDLLLAREATLDRQGRRAEQIRAIAELRALAVELGERGRLAEVWLRQASLAAYTGRPAEAREAGEQALALFHALADQTGEARALRELGFLHWASSQYTAALDYCSAALQLHRRQGDGDGEATALHNLAEIHRSLGSPRQALDLYSQALQLHWSHQNLRGQGMACYGLAQALCQVGELQRGRARYRQALEAARAGGDRVMEGRVHHELAGLYWDEGDTGAALAELGEALRLSREVGYGPGVAYGLLSRSQIEGSTGDSAAARASVAEALELFQLLEDAEGRALAVEQAGALDRLHHHGRTAIAGTSRVVSHVAAAEGKVYCTFTSPLARAHGLDQDT